MAKGRGTGRTDGKWTEHASPRPCCSDPLRRVAPPLLCLPLRLGSSPTWSQHPSQSASPFPALCLLLALPTTEGLVSPPVCPVCCLSLPLARKLNEDGALVCSAHYRASPAPRMLPGT